MILSAADARRAILTQLQAALPDALTAIANHAAMPLPAPRMWRRLSDYTNVPEEQLPGVYVVAGNLDTNDIDYNEAGTRDYWANLPARIVAVVAGRSMEEAQDRASHYVTAIRYALTADVTLGGQATSMEWGAESPAGEDGGSYYRAQADTTVTYRLPVPASLPDGLDPGNPQSYAIDEILLDLHHAVGPDSELPTPEGDGP